MILNQEDLHRAKLFRCDRIFHGEGNNREKKFSQQLFASIEMVSKLFIDRFFTSMVQSMMIREIQYVMKVTCKRLPIIFSCISYCQVDRYSI